MKIYILLFIFITFTFSFLVYPQKKSVNYRRDTTSDSALIVADPYQFSNIHRSGVTVWTELNPKVPRTDYLSIYFTCADTGWSVGAGGAIIKTTNGGTNWETKNGSTAANLLCVNSFDGKIIIACGFDGTILRSDDAGENWTQVQSNVTGDLWSVQMTSKYIGWICGLNSALLKTTNGGLTWQPVNTEFTNNYWALKFKNNTGYIACSNGKLLKTTDFGLTWNIKAINLTNNLYSLYMFDSLRIIAGGQGAVLAKTTDGGEMFTYNYGYDDINSIAFSNDSVGCVFEQNGGVYHITTNGGNTWTWTSDIIVGGFCGIFVNDSTGYNCGDKIKINKSTDKGFVWKKLIINDDFNDICFINENKGFITGEQLYYTNNGGYTLTPVPYNEGGQNTFITGQEIFFTDSLVGLIGGYQYYYRTIDGGLNWTKIPIDISAPFINYLCNFFQQSENKLWAFYYGKALISSNKGETWQNLFNEGIYTQVYFIDSLYGWMGKTYNTIEKTTNGGATWQQITINPYFVDDMHFINREFGYILYNGSLYCTSDGGYNWVPDSTFPYYGTLPGKFKWFDARHGLVIGSSATLETNDSGKTWINITNQLGYTLINFTAPNRYLGYGVATGGLLVSYYNESYIPVALTSFNVYEENNKIICRWHVAEESGITGYCIERSFDGIIWNIKGFVPTRKLNTYSFIDKAEGISKIYYRIKTINLDGKFNYSGIVEFNSGNKMFTFLLFQNFPNPFNPETIISFSIKEQSNVKLVVFDVLGRKIKELINEEKLPGTYNVKFNAGSLSTGIYFYTIITKNFIQTKKMMLLK